MKRAGRKEPYTSQGIRRVRCVRCGEPASATWQACSDGGLFRPICGACDVELNRLALTFMRDPEVDEKIEVYAASKGVTL